MELTNAQWECVRPLIPEPRRKPGGPGRPPADPRAVLNGILWILRTGAPWKDLPPRYPPRATTHRRFQEWTRSGVFGEILAALAKDLEERGALDLSEAFIDGAFAGAKKGANASERPNGAKGPRSWRLRTALVFLSPSTSTVLPHTK